MAAKKKSSRRQREAQPGRVTVYVAAEYRFVEDIAKKVSDRDQEAASKMLLLLIWDGLLFRTGLGREYKQLYDAANDAAKSASDTATTAAFEKALNHFSAAAMKWGLQFKSDELRAYAAGGDGRIHSLPLLTDFTGAKSSSEARVNPVH